MQSNECWPRLKAHQRLLILQDSHFHEISNPRTQTQGGGVGANLKGQLTSPRSLGHLPSPSWHLDSNSGQRLPKQSSMACVKA